MLLKVLVGSSILSIFVGTMIVRESHELVETSVRFMNDTVHQHPQFAIAAQDAYQRFITYMDVSSNSTLYAVPQKDKSSFSAWTSRALSTWPVIRKFQMMNTSSQKNNTNVLFFNASSTSLEFYNEDTSVPTPFPVLKTMFNHLSSYILTLSPVLFLSNWGGEKGEMSVHCGITR